MKLKKSIAITLSTLMFMSVTVSNVSASSSYESKASNQLEWNQKLYNQIDEKVNRNMPEFKSAHTYDITKSKYKKYVRTITEEYLTHPDQEYLLSLNNLKDFLKADAKKEKTYTGKALIKNTQKVEYYGDAIQKAIDEASSKKGGGVVVVPGSKDPNKPAVYYTGAIEMKSNVELRIEENAVLKFVRNKTNEYYPVVYTR